MEGKFEITEGVDKFGRRYKYVVGLGPKNETEEDYISPPKIPIYAMILTYNCEDYLEYCLAALKDKVDGVFVVDNDSNDSTKDILIKNLIDYRCYPEKGDLSFLANKCLDMIPKDSWVLYVNPDEILYDCPKDYFRFLYKFMEENNMNCADARFRDFIYNYGTLFAGFDWGEGPGNYWTARRLFKWTGKERFKHPTHFNISNTTDPKAFYLNNNEHTGEWIGTVAKVPHFVLFHYGKLRGIENQRHKTDRILNGEMMARGQVATIPYIGKHPSVMGL